MQHLVLTFMILCFQYYYAKLKNGGLYFQANSYHKGLASLHPLLLLNFNQNGKQGSLSQYVTHNNIMHHFIISVVQ